MWNCDVRSVHLTMTKMVKQGLLYRRPGVGTFVRRTSGALENVCIYYPHNILGSRGSRYLQILHERIAEALQSKGVNSSVWVDSRSDQEAKEPWEPLAVAARSREFQGIIAPVVLPDVLQWLKKLPVPSVFQSSTEDNPHAINYDMKQFVQLSLHILAEKGCRSVALLCPITVHAGIPSHHPIFDHFQDAARTLGLQIKSEGLEISSAPPAAYGTEFSHERLGYEQFQTLWREDKKPDGLVVYPDSITRGVIYGILENALHVPEDLKLVLHRNVGVEMFCPFAADFIVSDERDMARALVSQLERNFCGEPVGFQRVPFHRA